MEISYILFDLDDTLYSSSSGMAGEFMKRILDFVSDYLGISREEASRRREERRFAYGTTLQWLMAEEGLTDADAYFLAIHPPNVSDYLAPRPELKRMLSSLPYRMSVLTNSPREHAERVCKALGIYDCMEHIFDLRFNRLTGKPAASAYTAPLQRIGFQASQVLFLDDMPPYLYAFQKMGGNVLLVDEKGRFSGEPLKRIEKIDQLPRFLESH